MNDQIILRIGEKIKQIRTFKKFKLHEVATDASISKGLLSKIENGRTIPSVPVLISIIRALDTDIANFFDGIEFSDNSKYIIRKKAEYRAFQKEEAVGFLYRSILGKSILSLNIEVVLLELEPGSKRKKITTDGFELKYILEGEVEYHIGNDVLALEKGDSLFFDGRIPHVPINVKSEKAVMLVVYFLLPQET